MSNTRIHKVKATSSKWLFAAILLLSLFTFSGLATQVQTDQAGLKTTLVVSSWTESGRSITYSRASQQNNTIYHYPGSKVLALSDLHSQQTKTAFERLSFVVVSQTGRLHTRIISQNSDDEFPVQLG